MLKKEKLSKLKMENYGFVWSLLLNQLEREIAKEMQKSKHHLFLSTWSPIQREERFGCSFQFPKQTRALSLLGWKNQQLSFHQQGIFHLKF